MCVPLASAGTANWLRHLLEKDPDMRALLTAAPQLGRILRPLWHMVSPDPFPAEIARPRRPIPPPEPATAAPPAASAVTQPGLLPNPA